MTNSSATQFTLQHDIDCFIKHIPQSTSITIGIFLDVSLYDEPLKQGGISHFLEHMCFRGTKNRSAYQITKEIDALGGHINAGTHKEFTQYYVTLLPEHIKNGIDIITDITFNSVLKDKDINLEKSIISEEINMYEDSPDEKIYDIFSSKLFKESYLGNPILGTKKSISSFNSTMLNNYYSNYFDPSKIKIVISGKINDKTKTIKYLNEKISKSSIGSSSFKKTNKNHNPKFKKTTHHTEKDLEQFHLCLGYPGISINDSNRFPLTILSTIIGGSMSSRLFQEIREKKGLAYSIYSHASFYKDTGSFSIYAGTSKENFKNAKNSIINEINSLLKNGVTQDEFNRSKQQLKGNLIINLENSSAWTSWLGKQMIYNTGLSTIKHLIDQLNNVTLTHVQKTANDLLNKEKMVIVSLGK